MTPWLDWAQQYPNESAVVWADSVESVQSVLRSSDASIRVAGAGHSFSPLLGGAEVLLRVDRIAGVHGTSRDGTRATVGAGTRLRDLNAQLHDKGLALRNLGDIDVQSVAGATATATHGTGRELPCLSADIRALEFVDAQGDVHRLTDNDAVCAARVGLGSIGVITSVELDVVPSFRLHRRTWSEPLGTTLESAGHRWRTHRNYEFFIIPNSGYALSITHDLTDADVRNGAKGDDDKAVRDLRLARTLLGWAPRLRRKVLQREIARFPAEDSVDYSWRLLASERNVRFKEMEYHLPVATAMPVISEVVELIERTRADVFFPIEVRMTAGDDSWLSPFFDGPRISVAVHAWYRDEDDFMFDVLEPIFLAAGGRPHWGKLHSLTAQGVAQLYPRFDDFVALRDQWDPDGRFLNPHTRALFAGSDVHR